MKERVLALSDGNSRTEGAFGETRLLRLLSEAREYGQGTECAPFWRVSVETSPLNPPISDRCECLVCGDSRLTRLFVFKSHPVVACGGCGLQFLNPQPGDEELSAIYTEHYFLSYDTEEGRQSVSLLKRATARQYLGEIESFRGTPSGRLLEVGCGEGDFLAEAESVGFEVEGVEYSSAACKTANQRLKRGKVRQGELEAACFSGESFDVVVLNDVIEHVRSPLAVLGEIHRILKPGGTLFLATPSLDSWSARIMGQHWMEWKPEHLSYFNRESMTGALRRAGFSGVQIRPGWKILSFDYVHAHFEKFPVAGVTLGLRLLGKMLPAFVRGAAVRIVASGMNVFCRKTQVASE